MRRDRLSPVALLRSSPAPLSAPASRPRTHTPKHHPADRTFPRTPPAAHVCPPSGRQARQLGCIIHVYTMGSYLYTQKVLDFLDPAELIFGVPPGKIMCRPERGAVFKKSIGACARPSSRARPSPAHTRKHAHACTTSCARLVHAHNTFTRTHTHHQRPSSHLPQRAFSGPSAGLQRALIAFSALYTPLSQATSWRTRMRGAASSSSTTGKTPGIAPRATTSSNCPPTTTLASRRGSVWRRCAQVRRPRLTSCCKT